MTRSLVILCSPGLTRSQCCSKEGGSAVKILDVSDDLRSLFLIFSMLQADRLLHLLCGFIVIEWMRGF